jgi:hypothetical protein
MPPSANGALLVAERAAPCGLPLRERQIPSDAANERLDGRVVIARCSVHDFGPVDFPGAIANPYGESVETVLYAINAVVLQHVHYPRRAEREQVCRYRHQ